MARKLSNMKQRRGCARSNLRSNKHTASEEVETKKEVGGTVILQLCGMQMERVLRGRTLGFWSIGLMPGQL